MGNDSRLNNCKTIGTLESDLIRKVVFECRGLIIQGLLHHMQHYFIVHCTVLTIMDAPAPRAIMVPNHCTMAIVAIILMH